MDKKLITLCAALAAVVLAGCQKEKESEPVYAGPTHTVTFTAEKILDSKTAIASEADGIVSYKWISGDEERMHISESYLDGETTKTNQGTNVTMSPSADGKTATFVVTFEGEAPSGEVTYNAVYAGSVSKAGNALIPSVQHPAANSFDPAADVMVADPIVKSARDENPSFRFLMNRKVSVNKMTLKGLTAGEIVSSVTFESDKSHSAYYVLNPKEGNSSYTANGKKLSFVYTADNEIPTSGEFPVYFTTAPVEGATFTVRVVTDQAVYEKTSTKTIDFACGSVRRFGVNLAGCREEITTGDGFTLISSTEDIPTSCEVLIVGVDGEAYYAAGAQAENNRRGASVPAPDSNNTITLESTSEAHIFVLEHTTSGYTFKDKDSEEYLYPASSKSNHLKSAALGDNSYWTITIANGVATVTGTTTQYTRNLMRFNPNNGSPLISCYASTSTTGSLVSLYANSQSAVIDSRVDPDFSFENEKIEFRIDDTAARTDFGSGQELTNPQELSATWTSSNENIATVDANGNVTIVDGAYGSVTITATFAGNETYKPAAASYTLVIGSTVGLAIENQGEHILLEATVYAAIGGDNEYEAFIVGDETAKLFCYKKGHGLEIGDVVRLEGSTSIYAQSGVYELSPETITKIGHVDSVDHGTALDYDANASDLVTIFAEKEDRHASTHSARYVHVTGTQLKRIITTTGNNKVREYIKEADVADLNADVDIYAYAYDLSAEASANLMNILVVSKTIVGQRDPAGISYDTASYDLTIGAASYTDFTAPTLTNPNNLTGITYESSNSDVAVVDASTGAVTLQGTAGTATITASFAGNESYAAGTASYTINVRTSQYDFETVAQLNALVTSTSADYSGYLTNAVVSFVPTTNTAIVKDATGSVMIYKSGHGLKQGQTYTGAINVTAIKYNSLYSEITVWDAAFTGTESVVAPESVELSALIGHYDDYQNAYVQVAGLTVSSVDGKNIHVTNGTSSYVVYDNTSSISVGVGDVITAIGTVTKYQTTEEIKVWNAADVTVTASAPKAITFTQPSAGGSFTVKVDGNSISSGTTVASGKTVTLIATAASGFTFNGWSVSGATVADDSATTTTFTMGTSAVTVAASFKSAGSVTPDPETITFANWSPALENGVQYSDPFNGGNFTITFGGGGNDGKYYTTGSGIRTYGNGTITVESSYTISKIEFTWGGSSYAPSTDVASPTGYNQSTSTWTGSAKKVVLTRPSGSGQWRLQAVKVTY